MRNGALKSLCVPLLGIALSDYLNFYQVLYSINDIDTALVSYVKAQSLGYDLRDINIVFADILPHGRCSN